MITDKILIGAVLALAVVAAGLGLRLNAEQKAHLKTDNDFIKYRADAEEAGRKQEGEYRALEQRFRTLAGSIDTETAAALATARADAAGARTERDGLLHDYATLVTRHRNTALAAATPGQCPPADPTAGVCQGLLSRLSQRATVYAEWADTAHAAGAGCQRTYDAVTP